MAERLTQPPNHVTVTVVSARNLQSRAGRGAKIGAFAVVSVGGRKAQTSVQHTAADPVWQEQCEFFILDVRSQTMSISVYRRAFLGLDEKLGQFKMALDELYRPEAVGCASRSRWFPLRSKKASRRARYCGEVEVSVDFAHRSVRYGPGSGAKMVSSQSDYLLAKADKSKAQTLPRTQTLTENGASFVDLSDGESPRQKLSLGSRKAAAATAPARSRRQSVPVIPNPFAQSPPTADDSAGQQDSSTNRSLDEIQEEKKASRKPKELRRATEPSQQSNSDGQLTESIGKADKGDAARSRQIQSATSGRRESMKRTLTTGCVHSPPSTPLSSAPAEFDPNESLINLDLIYDTLSKDDLFGMIKEQRLRIVKQQRRIRDLEEHIDHLSARVMQINPDLLHGPAQKGPIKIRF